jgi:hypothetical protein
VSQPRTYRLVRYRSANDRGYAAAIDVYIRNISPRLKTDTDEIAYWLEHFNDRDTDHLYVFGFLMDGVPIGFGMGAYFGNAELFIVDYIVIEKQSRKNNTFYEFVDQITSYLEKEQPGYRYCVAEVCRLSDTDEPSDESRAVVRLLKQQGFAVVRAPYTTPRLGLDAFEAEMRTDLLILSREKLESIHAETYRTIVRTIFFDYFGRWYSIYEEEAAAYDAYLEELCERVLRDSPSPRVPVNGHKVVMTESTPPPPHRQIVDFTALALLCIAVFSGAMFYMKHRLQLSDSSFITVYVLILVTTFGVMAVVSAEARLVFYRILSLARLILSQKNTKLQAKARKPGTSRKRSSKAAQRDAADTSDE